MRIAFFGSSLVSSYWNGAATYYRGLLKALAKTGQEISFYEPDAYDRQSNRDIADPDWARVIVYPATEDGWQMALEQALVSADLVVKASGVGVFDHELEEAIPEIVPRGIMTAYWDVDAPATLEAMDANPEHHLRKAIANYDVVFTYGGGDKVVRNYLRYGARQCVPIYNALDPDTHHPAPRESKFECDLGFLGNRLPDRESRVEEFFFKAAAFIPNHRFLLGGSGWETKETPGNVRKIGHVLTDAHNAFFCSGLATLNINRGSMARYGFSPPTRIFEAAGAGACIITDHWEGINAFLVPDEEILVANDGAAVAVIVRDLDEQRARIIGEAARAHVLSTHTYRHRARQVLDVLQIAPTNEEAAE